MDFSLLNKKLLLFILPLSLLGQVNEKNLTQLSYKELTDLYYDNVKDTINQIKYADAYLKKAKTDKDLVRKAKAYYMYSLINKDDKAIAYLDSVIKYSKNSNHKYFPASAYCEKAYILQSQFKFKEAMNNYLLAEKRTLKTNIDYYYVVRGAIGILKSQDLGEVEEGLAIYKECYNYYKKKDIRDKKYSKFYINILFSLASSFKSLHKTDSTTFYNKLGYKESKIAKNDFYISLFILNEGANEVIKKKYTVALDSIKKALPKMIEFDNKNNILTSYYYQGLSYQGLGKKELAAKCFIRVDSIYNITNYTTPEFTSGYEYLISYYKEKGDKTNQLQYLTKYNAIDKILQKNYKQMYKLLQKEYDIPHLIKDKDSEIKSLKKNIPLYYWGLGSLLFIALGFGLFSLYQRKLYKKRFQEIIANTKSNSSSVDVNEETIIDKNDNEFKDIVLSDELKKGLLEKLNDFEINKGYLQSNITSQILSDKFKPIKNI